MGKTYKVAAQQQVAAQQVVAPTQQAIVIAPTQQLQISNLRSARIAAVQRCYTARKIAAKQATLVAAQQVAAQQVLQASKLQAYNLAMLQLNAATQLAVQQLSATYGIVAPVQQVAPKQVAKKQPSVKGKIYTVQGAGTKGELLWGIYTAAQQLQNTKLTCKQAIAAAQAAGVVLNGSVTAAYYHWCSAQKAAAAQ